MARAHKEDSARAVAIQILEKVENKGAYVNFELNASMNKHQMNTTDQNFLTELVYGVMQNRNLIDYYLEPYLKKPKQVDSWVRQTLRLAVYQLVFLDGIPDYAAINEAVSYSKRRGHKGIGGMVNGVLRNLLRHNLNDPNQIQDPSQALATRYSLPNWLVERLIQQYGQDETQKMAESFNQRAKTAVRVNTERISRQEARAVLEADGYQVKNSQLADSGLIIENGLPIKHDLYLNGKISIQDESAMMIAPAMSIAGGHIVADLCAAPGGKSGHIATYLNQKIGGKLYASDIYEHKVKLVRDNLRRQGFESVSSVSVLDALEANQYYKADSFDRVLVDAPCSGIGLLRRKPDIRYSKSNESVAGLPKLQLGILNKAAGLVKNGGVLLYSTCTILQVENESVVRDFLAENPEFNLQAIDLGIDRYKDNRGEIRILPHHFDSDGFYLAALVKNG